jgi:hypothetical protein
MSNNSKIDTFQSKLNDFIETFYHSEEYVNFKMADKELYNSAKMQEYNQKKEGLESELNLIAKEKGELSKEDIEDMNQKFLLLKKTVQDLDCVKNYETAYDSLMKVRNIFNRELLRKLYL